MPNPPNTSPPPPPPPSNFEKTFEIPDFGGGKRRRIFFQTPHHSFFSYFSSFLSSPPPHVYPQAMKKRPYFIAHHIDGRLQMSNIHSTVNLIALCSVCHYAFDAEEWTFLPVGMSEWIQAANAEPEKNFIPIWNAQRNIQYRPWRLMVDTQASNDWDFNLASTNNPLKTWTGELGALILSLDHLHSIKFRNPSTGPAEAIQEFR